MHPFVAFHAKRDQGLLRVATRVAAEFEMVHLQILHTPAGLAAPTVALQHLPVQISIARRIESQSRVFGWDLLHEACPATSERKASGCCCDRSGRRREPDGSRDVAERRVVLLGGLS